MKFLLISSIIFKKKERNKPGAYFSKAQVGIMVKYRGSKASNPEPQSQVCYTLTLGPWTNYRPESLFSVVQNENNYENLLDY